MPAPTNAESLTLGYTVVDSQPLETIDDMRDAIRQLQMLLRALGAPAPARNTDDTTYQAVYARQITGTWHIYGGKPTDPINPDEISLSGSGTGTTVTLWCIDPAGGHTFTSTGTTATVDIKVLKVTFDAINLASSVSDTVTITYTGGEDCA